MQLKKFCNYFIENREEIKKMGKNAKETVSKYSWENYQKNIYRTLIKIYDEK